MKLRLAAIAAIGLIGAVAASAASWWSQPEPIALVERSDPLEGARPSAREGAPNVVLVIGCTVRKDQLSVYGGPAETTPFLAQLAAEGALFTDAIAAAPWTKASSTALLTGRHPSSVGMVEPGPGRNDRRLGREWTTLAEHLRGAGYHTVGATANPNLNAVFGFEQGFDRYLQLESLWRDDMLKLGAVDLLPRVGTMLDAVPQDGRPLYLQVLLVDAHAPYDATASERERFSEPDLPEEVAAYRVALARFDGGLASLVSLLEARGYERDDTVFVVVSDHGEGLSWPEHHGKAHGMHLAPSAVGALWTARGPGIGEGVEIDGVASGVDLVPTLLGLLDVPGYEGTGVDHSDLLASGGRSTRTHAFSDTWFIDVNRAAVYTHKLACQRDFDLVAPTEPGHFREGCFRRLRDPLHTRPIPNSALEQVLVDWREARRAEMQLVRTEDVAPPTELEAQLEALGYVDR